MKIFDKCTIVFISFKIQLFIFILSKSTKFNKIVFKIKQNNNNNKFRNKFYNFFSTNFSIYSLLKREPTF